jgi:hypothetical protein
MAYLEQDVHDYNAAELGNLIFTSLDDNDVIMVDVRMYRRRRTMRIWFTDVGGDLGDPIDPDERENRM